jgi:hypothetical protein
MKRDSFLFVETKNKNVYIYIINWEVAFSQSMGFFGIRVTAKISILWGWFIMSYVIEF